MRLTRPLLLLALAALMAPRAAASRTSVWESNPPAAAVLTTTNAAGLLAPLAPAGSLESIVADVEPVEPLRFDLGDVVLVENPREDGFRIGLADVVEPPALRGPPLLDGDPHQAFELRDPETRIRGLELLPPFRVGASASLSLWGRQACGFSCREVVSDSRYDPWGLCPACGPTFAFGTNPGQAWQQTQEALADGLTPKDPGLPIDKKTYRDFNSWVRRNAVREPQKNLLWQMQEVLAPGLNDKLRANVDDALASFFPTTDEEDEQAKANLMLLPAIGSIEGPGAAVRPGVANNVRGGLFENLIDSAFRRFGRYPFFRPLRRGGIDLVTLEGADVVLNEAKFARSLQYDDFTAITTNLRSNVEEIVAGLAGSDKLNREEKEVVRATLGRFLEGEVPGNLRIRVVTGKKAVGPKLQKRLEKNTSGLPIEFTAHPEGR